MIGKSIVILSALPADRQEAKDLKVADSSALILIKSSVDYLSEISTVLTSNE